MVVSKACLWNGAFVVVFSFIVKWVTHCHTIAQKAAARPRAARARGLFGFAAGLKYSSTRGGARNTFFRLKRNNRHTFETYGPEQRAKNRARMERRMTAGRTNTAHLFADQPELLPAPRARAKPPLN